MRVIILGAGIAGLSTAIALKQKGIDVAIYEKQHAHQHAGAGIVCWPNASFVLDKLGILNDIRVLAGRPTHMHRLSDKGESLGSLDIQALDTLMGYPSLSILRKDLMQTLEAHARKLHIAIHYASGAKSLFQKKSGSTLVELQDGSHLQADLIIGADGRMNSLTRAFVNGDNTPIYQGFINWVGIFESSRSTFNDIAVSDYWGVGQRFGLVPISSRKAYWAGAIASASRSGEKDEIINKQQELLDLFKQWPATINNIIQTTPTANIHKIYVHDHDPITTWHKDNVLLIGDAAHAPLPTSGQGACQALEDAWHLIQTLEQYDMHLPSVFQAFTQKRFTKTKSITQGARQLASSIFNTDTSYCLQRNQQSKTNDYNGLIKGMAAGWGRDLPIALPS